MKYKRFIQCTSLLIFLAVAFYGFGRLYYFLTGGFTLDNIHSKLTYHQEWDTRPLTMSETQEVKSALDQSYHYLSKGCQSYVFLSDDRNYVIKFFKFQRLRPQKWIDLFTFIPAVDRYQHRKTEEKALNLHYLFLSCKLGFNVLPFETGLIYVHLNKTKHELPFLKIYDKLRSTRQLNLDQLEFILQRRAHLLGDAIDDLMAVNRIEGAKVLIDRLLIMILSEYHRGYADNDHALMQNTGVLNGYPMHIDVGQLIYNEVMLDEHVYHQELLNKMTQLQKWLAPRYPELLDHLNNRLLTQLGADYYTLPPYIYNGHVAKIPHQIN